MAYYDEIAGLYENAPVMLCQPLTMANVASAFPLNNHCPTAGLEASQNQEMLCAICSGSTPKNCCWVLTCDAALPGTESTQLCCRNRACVQSTYDAKDSNVVETCGELVSWPYTVIFKKVQIKCAKEIIAYRTVEQALLRSGAQQHSKD